MVSDRARQFLPFDALKGYKELIKEQERIKVSKKELTDDDAVYLSNVLNSLKKGMMVEVIYFENDEYIKVIGMVSRIDLVNRYIFVVKKQLLLDNIWNIRLLNNWNVN